MNVETEFPELWDETDLRPYLGEVKRRHGIVETLALPSMRDLPPVQIETLFVPPLLAQTTVSADSDPSAWPPGKNLLAELQDYRQLVVLGDPGGGKTTLSNWLAWRLAAGLNSPLPSALSNRVPIPCVLRDMPVDLFTTDVDLIDVMSSVVDNLFGTRPTAKIKSALLDRLYSGGYVLILDGIDEIPIAHRVIVAKWIRQAYLQSACVLATSRIVGYEDYPVDCSASPSSHIGRSSGDVLEGETLHNLENILPIASKLVSEVFSIKNIEIREPERWAHIRYLMPFDQGRIASFAENWYRQRCMTELEATQKTTDLLAALSQSEVTQKLARTPNLLSLMAIVHRERAHLPDGKALLYEEIANAYINTIDKQRKIAPGDILAQYGWNDRKAWLAYVGFKMQATRNRSVDRDTGILVDESDVLLWLTEAMTVSEVPEPTEAAATFLYWVARRSGLLLPRGEARYAFVHLSFQEYFCACYLESCVVRLSFIRDTLKHNADVTKDRLRAWSRETHWLETLVFLFEMLSTELDPEWVNDLANVIFSEVEDFSRFNSSSDFAARVIKNKHIKISKELRDSLAVRLGSKAISEWEGDRFSDEPEILSALLGAGYAVAVIAGEDNPKLKGSLQIKCVNNLDDVLSPDKVRVLILEGLEGLDLKALKEFVNVRFLRIKDVALNSSSVFELFNSLELLHIINVSVKDIEPIDNFVGMKYLKIHDVPVVDISPVSKLKSLELLELHGVQAFDLSSISSLKSLKFFSLRDVPVEDVSPIGDLKKLQTLLLGSMPSVDLSPLSKLKNLDYLRLISMPIKNLKFCSGMKKLSTLYFLDLDVEDFSAIAGAKWIASIYLFGCRVSSLQHLSGVTDLNSLGLLDMSVQDIGFVRGLRNLSSFYISGSSIDDLSPLSSLKKMFSLSLNQSTINDISSLVHCKELRFLDITTESSIDVACLADISKLRSLTIRSPEIINLDVLEKNQNLQIDVES